MRSYLFVLCSLLPLCANAQPNCSAANFLTARPLELKPTATTHIDVVRQGDGSFSGFEVTDAPPHRTIAVTTHFDQQFAACLPRPSVISGAALKPRPFTDGAGSQSKVTLSLPAGRYFAASLSALGQALHFDLFDSAHMVIFDSDFAYSAPEPFTPSNRTDVFTSLNLADVNGDGMVDVIASFRTNRVAGRIDVGVWTFTGNGDGTFQSGKRSAFVFPAGLVTPVGSSFALADLNGDGIPDLAFNAGLPDLVRVVLGAGDGTFKPSGAPASAVGSGVYGALALADLDGDGKTDLISTVPSTVGNADSVAVARGRGDGSFGPATVFSVLPAAGAIAVADLNGDLIPDIATGSGTILFGDGTGAFPSRRDYAVRAGSALRIFDADRDGNPDLVFGTGSQDFISAEDNFALTILFGEGKGKFTGAPVVAVPPAGSSYPAFAAADFDGDGLSDIASLTTRTGVLRISLLRGAGTTDYAPSQAQSFIRDLSYTVRSVIAADFNRDGRPDLAVIGRTRTGTDIDIYPGNGDGTFAAPSTLSLPDTDIFSAFTADLNGDGVGDVVVTTSTSVVAWLGKGDGTLGVSPAFTVQAASPAIALADFNRDGKPDLLIGASGSAAVTVLLGRGDGTFPATVTSSLTLPDPAYGMFGDLGVADFNGDGLLDIVFQTLRLGNAPQYTAVAFGQGNGSFSGTSLSPVSLNSVRTADFNGDGIADLVGIAGTVAVRIGNGDGTFQPALPLPSVGTPVIVDINRDGLPDLLALAPSGVAVFLNLTQTPPDLSVVSAASFAADALAPGSIAAAFGANMIAGSTVDVRDSAGVARPAHIFSASRNQVNFLVPGSSAPGPATVTLSGGPNAGPLVARIQLAPIAPALFTAGSDVAAAYAIQVASDGTQSVIPVFTGAGNSALPQPIDLTGPGQVYLVLYGSGFDSAPATSLTATVQGLTAPVTYAGPVSGFPGLDQVNILLPRPLSGAGVAGVTISVAGRASNTVRIALR